MIEAIELTSIRRSRGAGCGPVENISFDVYPGQVTALLGAPGTGKSTVLRMMVDLEPAAGRTLFGGRPYRALRPAVREVGLALNPDAVHPGRTVQAHLQLYSAAGGVPKPRLAEVLEVAGLSLQATVRCGRLDAGQRQRLAIAAALLGDPAALILDEPHALDRHGMSWFHALIRAYAAQGRTVLVAATDPDTLAGTADHVVILRRDDHDGVSRVIASRSAAEVFEERRATVVQVRSPQAARLAAALETEGARLAPAGPGALRVRGLDRARIGEVAHGAGICLHELSELDHDDDVFGLRPLPRQKDLLPGLNRAAGIWRSGVRLVTEDAKEIGKTEETEIVEVAAAQSATAGVAAIGMGTADEQQVAAGQSAAAGTRASSEQGAEQGGGAVLAAAELPSQSSTVWSEAPTEAAESAEMQRWQGSIADRSNLLAAETAVAEHAELWQGSMASSHEPATADSYLAAAKPSWRSPNSQWSTLATSGQPLNPAATTRRPASSPILTAAATSTIDSQVHADPAEAATTDAPEAPTFRRSAAFGLRWSRSRPEASQHPVPSSETATAAQPAVPFTVAAPMVERDAGDGMTPWRAVAARASQQSQQQGSVAEAAPAEQEASA